MKNRYAETIALYDDETDELYAVDVTFTFTPGYPAITNCPPEYSSPGADDEYDIISVIRDGIEIDFIERDIINELKQLRQMYIRGKRT